MESYEIDEVITKLIDIDTNMKRDIVTSTSSNPDLTTISTRDLLNEAFRRGAIEQMNFRLSVPDYMMDDNEYVEHMNRKILVSSLTDACDELKNAGVFNIGKRPDYDNASVEMSVDYFICVHPLTLKGQEGAGNG